MGLKLLIGAEIAPVDAPAVVLWATDRASYARLSQLITRGCRRCEKGQFEATLADIADHAPGLLAGVVMASEIAVMARSPDRAMIPTEGLPERQKPSVSRVAWSEHHATTARRKRTGRNSDSSFILPPSSFPRPSPLTPHLHRYREIFGDRCYAMAELHCGPRDEQLLDEWMSLARQARVPLVAAGDVYYHRRSRLPLADVLTATRLGCTVAEAGEALFPNAERYLKDPEEMAARFARARAPSSGVARSQRGQPSRSTSCAMNIRRSWPLPDRRHWNISRGSLGPVRRSVIPARCPKKSAGCSSTNSN